MVALLLPGMSLNATIFPVLPFPSVAIDFNHLRLGTNGETPDLIRRRMDFYVDLLDERLAAHSEWKAEPRIVVGHSFGGMLAMAWWLAHGGKEPARVRGFVLVSTSAGPMFDAVRLRIPGTRLRVPMGLALRAWNTPAMTRAAKRCFAGAVDRVEPVDFAALPRPTDWSVDRAGWRATDWRAMRSYRLAMDGLDLRNRLAEITIPVIVLHGTRDSLFPLDTARELAGTLPNADLRVVRGAGHALPLLYGAEIRRAVTDLASLP